VTSAPPSPPDLTLSRVFRLFWPLGLSWLLMGAELPIFAAFVARMTDAKIHLAAYSSVVFPLSLVIEGPIIMLLAASTALCCDWTSYRKVRRFMTWTSAILTALHILVAFTPIFDFVAVTLLKAPEEVIEPARIGLRIMTPWTWAIAYRRFQQGVLIRFERSRAVVIGSLVRLISNVVILSVATSIGGIAGIVAGTTAVATSVVLEAAFAGWCVRPILREQMPQTSPDALPLTRLSFLRFYFPLALTPLLMLLIQPMGSATMGRMPVSLDSLATWPAMFGLVFLTRGVGFAFNEVVVALVGVPGAPRLLRRFGFTLAISAMSVLFLIAATPLAHHWFEEVSGLPPELVELGSTAVFFALLMPGYQALQSWYQGVLVHLRRTRPITEAVVLYLLVVATALSVGISVGHFPGIYWVLVSFTLGGVVQTTWLAWRSRQPIAELEARGA
jgi:hypothetical protein